MSVDRLAGQLASLRMRFLEQLPERIRQLEEALARIEHDDDSARAVRVLAHNLAGAGATFACPAVSEAARHMEVELFPPGNAQARFNPGSHVLIPGLLADLKATVREALEHAGPDLSASSSPAQSSPEP